MEKRKPERSRDTRALATACDLGPVSSATKSVRKRCLEFCHPLRPRGGGNYSSSSCLAHTYPCVHLLSPDPQRPAPRGHCSCGALGPGDTQRPGPLAASQDCCALSPEWETRASAGHEEGQLAVRLLCPPQPLAQDQVSLPGHPPLPSPHQGLTLGAGLAAVSWQQPRLHAGQGWTLGFDVLAADSARTPCSATPLRLLVGKTGKTKGVPDGEGGRTRASSSHGVRPLCFLQAA